MKIFNKIFLSLVLGFLINMSLFAMEQHQSTFNRVCIVFNTAESRNTFNLASTYVEALGVPVLAEAMQGGVEVFKLIYNLVNELSSEEIDLLLAQTTNPNLLQNLNLNNVVMGVGYEKIDIE